MKKDLFWLYCLLVAGFSLRAQSALPRIEPGPCLIKIGSGVEADCGFIVVPENRQKPDGRSIKLPFVYLRKAGEKPTDITLYVTGGPGYSTIANYDSISRDAGILSYGGFIIFDQRGTKNALPCLDCPEIDAARRKAYREVLPKDSLILAAVKSCRGRLLGEGIDLSAYTTLESAADINDLRLALGIDSLTLFGISYSGGLMLTVARNYPEGVKALLLGSPLPGFVNYEEHALFNMNEALNKIFDRYEADTTAGRPYGDLRSRFHRYFTEIHGKSFAVSFQENEKTDPIPVRYTKNELLDAVIDRINNQQWQTVPQVIDDLIEGRHENYVQQVLRGYFADRNSLAEGMRYSIYCTEQIAYSDPELIKKQDEVLPWLAGYPFNNVDHDICDCWQVNSEPPVVKTPVYSRIPALIAAGDLDPWCPPFYNTIIKRYMPNAQSIIISGRTHVPGFGIDGADFLGAFKANPYQKLVSTTDKARVE